MPKFADQWVVDKTLFDFVSGGSCGCCGRGFFLPDGIEGMINAISDLETDAANAEIRASEQSPWPPDMREQVWSDRVRLRVKMKKEMGIYSTFWGKHGETFTEWCLSLDPKILKKVFQIPRAEVIERVNTHYGIHSAFGKVLTAVTEQVAHFHDTKYPPDGRGDSEIAFEKALHFDRRGGFTLKVVDKEGNLQDDIIHIWLKRMASLGGPILLERTPKNVGNDEGADDAEEDTKNAAKPSFRMDRRVVRLLIARSWADALMQKFVATLPADEGLVEATSEDNVNATFQGSQGDDANSG